jgi:hypothetical protein
VERFGHCGSGDTKKRDKVKKIGSNSHIVILRLDDLSCPAIFSHKGDKLLSFSSLGVVIWNRFPLVIRLINVFIRPIKRNIK